VYTGGDQFSYNGHTWQAKWWTQGETPGNHDVWQDNRAC
jgi:chitinase